MEAVRKMNRIETKELPEIPPYRGRSKESLKKIADRRKENPKVRFSLPLNALASANLSSDELVSVVSGGSSTVEFPQNPKSASSPSLYMRKHNSELFTHASHSSTISLPIYNKKRNNMRPFAGFGSTKDTHRACVQPNDADHYKIPVPLVIRSPPKLSTKRAPGDELLDKEMIFNGTSYEAIEVIDDDSDKENDNDCIILGESGKGKALNSSPLKQNPINREDLRKPSNREKKSGSVNRKLSFKKVSSNKTTSNSKSPLKSALKKPPPKHKPKASVQESSLQVQQQAKDTEKHLQSMENSQLPPTPASEFEQQAQPSALYSQTYQDYQHQDYQHQDYQHQDYQQPAYQYPETQHQDPQFNGYYEHYHQPEQMYQYDYYHQQPQAHQGQYHYQYPSHDAYQNPYDTQGMYQDQQQEYYPVQYGDGQNQYYYSESQPQFQETPIQTAEANPFAAFDQPGSFQEQQAVEQQQYIPEVVEPARSEVSNLEQLQQPLSFPSQEATTLAQDEQRDIDNRYYQEANKQDYTQTVSNDISADQMRILSQSPRKHNHTRSKSSANILEDFGKLTLDDKPQGIPQNSPRRHRHTRTKSQSDILLQFDTKENSVSQTAPPKITSPVIYSQTGTQKEIVIPNLDDVKVVSSEDARKANNKLDFYLKDQLERNEPREEPPKISKASYSAVKKTKRVASPMTSQSSYASSLSLGRSVSTTASTSSSVYNDPEENVMIDLTKEDEEVVVIRNKAKGSIRSYRSIRHKDKSGKEQELLVVDEADDDTLDLIEQYGNDFEVHDSLRRKPTAGMAFDDLDNVYSTYMKYGGTLKWAKPVEPKGPLTALKSAPLNLRIASLESVTSSNSFQTGDEQKMVIGNIHDWKNKSDSAGGLEKVFEGIALKETRKNVSQASNLRQKHLSKARPNVSRQRVESNVISEPSSVRSTLEVLNPLQNLSNVGGKNRPRREVLMERYSRTAGGEYLDYNSSTYDFDSFIRSN